MKSKLVVCLFPLGLTILACGAGSGCSSSSSGVAVNEGGTTEGGNPEGGTGSETGPNDAATDTKPDGAITGAFVALTYGSCPTFTKCDSDPKGTWLVKGGCVLEEVFDGAKSQCPGIVESNVKFEARGNVIADGVTIARNTEVKFSADFDVPASCVTAVGGCANVAAALKFGGIMTATCTAGTAGACDCSVANQSTDNLAAESYTTSNGTLTTTGGTPRTYDYCVAGSDITYKETTANTAIPAILVLTKQ